MRSLILLCIACVFINCSSSAQNTKAEPETKVSKYKIEKTRAEWRKLLTPMQFYVLRDAGTERPWTSEFNKLKKEGTFICAACDTPLYESKHKFNSGTGWPSFDSAIEGNIEFDVDYKIGYARTELKCNTCGGHLGHKFNDGPRETTGERHCINGVALKFIPIN